MTGWHEEEDERYEWEIPEEEERPASNFLGSVRPMARLALGVVLLALLLGFLSLLF